MSISKETLPVSFFSAVLPTNFSKSSSALSAYEAY
nr:MAG TPA: hypothetical protein [Caudoviricetes sp.]